MHTSWLRSRLGGLLAWFSVVALVCGGLGWATSESLRLEAEQRLASENSRRAEVLHRQQIRHAENLRLQQITRAENLRLALWRLDTRLSPSLAREDSRPYPHYTAMHSPFPSLDNAGRLNAPGKVFLPSPLLTADLPEWMRLHFTLDAVVGWQSPQVVAPELVELLRKQPLELALHNVTAERCSLLEKLRKRYPVSSVLPTLIGNNIRPDPLDNSDVQNLETLQNRVQSQANEPGKPQSNAPSSARAGPQPTSGVNSRTAPQNTSELSDYLRRIRINNESKREGMQTYLNDGRNYPPWKFPFPQKTILETTQPVEVEIGSLKPIWLPDARQPDLLLLVRGVQVGPRPVYQGIVLDWPKLRELLTEEVADLLPDLRLIPLSESQPLSPDRTMTSLPVQIDPNYPDLDEEIPPVEEERPTSTGMTPLRIGLVFAWTAAVVALLAVGLGGWTLINLSERRIRFVSAVTHELRTPLTSLRLYLDLLTSGMITEETQRAEYLRTLHGESERLYRLINNVLDFARLEKQNPMINRRTVPIREILEQVQQSWTECCATSGKELKIANQTAEDATIETDTGLVEQILGNLIDNARKYSREASDPTILLRVFRENFRWILEVEDRGPGISHRESSAIFRAFRRGKKADETAGGVGLGLALAARWAVLLKGRLTVHAGVDGVGACFRLELP